MEDAAKVQNCNPSQAKCLVLGGLGVHVGSIFANLLELFFQMHAGLYFLEILEDFGLQRRSHSGSILVDLVIFSGKK